jgi:hypothetical protein
MTSMMLEENRLTNIACGCGYDYELFYKILLKMIRFCCFTLFGHIFIIFI